MRHARRAYAHTPPKFRYERWDCAVRALRMAVGLTYTQAHTALAWGGRRDRYGTSNRVMNNACQRYGFYGMGAGAPPTLTQFLRDAPQGRFVIQIRGHFAAVVNGTLHDWRARPRTRVLAAWALK